MKEEIVYYPAVFFADIIEHYGGSETYIEELINRNIAKAKANVLNELKNLLKKLEIVKGKCEKLDANNMGARILEDLNKIKNG